jgi:aryl-alcohol dehydrogenase-like predicted oxidoreductase
MLINRRRFFTPARHATAIIAARKGATPAQVALAWLLARKPWIVPITGTTKPSAWKRMGAASLQLATDDLREIEDATMAIKVQGARYPEELLKMTGL